MFWPVWPNRLVVSIAQASKQHSKLRVVSKPSLDNSQQILGIPAVVVGETNDVAFRQGQSDIASPRETANGTEVTDGKVRMAFQYRIQAVIAILIDNQHLEVCESLLVKASQ